MMKKTSLFVLLLISALAYVGKAQSDSDDLDLGDIVEDLIDTLLDGDDSDSSDDSDEVVTGDDGLLQQLITALQGLAPGLPGLQGFATAQNNAGGTLRIIGTSDGFNTASTSNFGQGFSGNTQCIPVETLVNQANLIGNSVLRAASRVFARIPGGASNIARQLAGFMTQGPGGTFNVQRFALQMARHFSSTDRNGFAQATLRQPASRVFNAIIRRSAPSNGLSARRNGGSARRNGVSVVDPASRLRNLIRASNCVTRDGGWSNWSAWRPADTQGQESRVRTCTVPSPACGGSPCQGPATESRVAFQTARVATGRVNTNTAAAAWSWGTR